MQLKWAAPQSGAGVVSWYDLDIEVHNLNPNPVSVSLYNRIIV